MVRWAVGRIEQGRTPFDGWYPYLGLGFPQFHHYQTLPHLLTAVLGTMVGGDRALRLTAYLLLALWPLAVYVGARCSGWGRGTAAAAAIAAPLLVSAPGYGYEQSSYTWQGLGLWSQLWGMCLLPLAWGLSRRAVADRRGLAMGALAVGLTLAVHVLTGYLALLTLVVWALVRPSALWGRGRRALAVGAGGLAATAWLLVPALVDGPWANYAGYERGSFYYDSFGARRVLGWLVSGSLFDEGRLPVVSVLVAAGAVVCAARWRRDDRARCLLGAFVLSLLLFCGRPTLGPLLGLLPGGDDLFLHRYILGVHLAGLWLAGVGGAAIAGVLQQALRRGLAALPARVVRGRVVGPALGPAVALVLGLAFLVPAWRERADYAGNGRQLIELQQRADRTDGRDVEALLEEVRRRGDGRVYAGLFNPAGVAYRVGSVPVFAEALGQDADAVGFVLRVASLSTAVETSFDETDAEHYEVFGVRYLLLPAERVPPVPAGLVLERGRHRLWQVDEVDGYVQVVDPLAPVAADRRSLAGAVGPLLRAPGFASRRPTVVFDGDRSTSVPASPEAAAVGSPAPGTVEPVVVAPEDGTWAARVRMARPGVVVLASSFHPRWQVVVDGEAVDPLLVAPSFVGASVDAGEHTVSFRYRPYPWSGPLLIGGLVVVAGLATVPRWWARRRRVASGTSAAVRRRWRRWR